MAESGISLFITGSDDYGDYFNINDLKIDTSKGYYKFTDDNKLIFSDETAYKTMLMTFGTIPEHNEFLSYSGNEVYSKDGFVYWKIDDRKVMSYAFPTSFPYANFSPFSTFSTMKNILNRVSKLGGLITYRLYDINGNLDDNIITQYQFLVRFKDDGTQDYPSY